MICDTFLGLQLSDQKQIRSWTVLEKLSNKVVYDGISRKYVGVFGQRNIKCWTDSETNLKKIRKIKVCRLSGIMKK